MRLKDLDEMPKPRRTARQWYFAFRARAVAMRNRHPRLWYFAEFALFMYALVWAARLLGWRLE